MKSILNYFNKPIIAFWPFAFIINLYLDYFKIFEMIPQGIHFMRQTDSLSIITHYIKSGMHFWEPGILNLESTDGKTASEFPLFYYLIALVYKLVGDHQNILKVFNTVVVFTGFFHIYKLFLQNTKDILLSIGITIFLSSSLVIYYYTNNYLPDATALGFTLIGCYYMYQGFVSDVSNRKVNLGLLLMILASLLKVSFFVYPATFVITYLVADILIQKTSIKLAFNKRWLTYVLFCLGIVLIGSWVLFVKNYNQVNHGYFLVKARSFFDADHIDRMEVKKNIIGWWADSYYPTLTKYFLTNFFIIALIRFNKTHTTKFILSMFSLLGVFVFFMLFFLQFKEHDYYFLAIVPALIIATFFSISSVQDLLPNQIGQWVLRFLVLYLCVSGLNQAKHKLWQRYGESKNDLYSIIGQKLDGYDKKLDEANISKDAKLIVIIDKNINAGLYCTRRFGWSMLDTSYRYLKAIPKCINQGATHFMLLDTNFASIPYIKYHIKDKVYSDSIVTLYTIKP